MVLAAPFLSGQSELEDARSGQEVRFNDAMITWSTGGAEALEEVVKQLKRLAVEGHARSQYYLAQFYLDGVGLTQNLEQGKLWLERASDSGYPMAMLQWSEVLLADGSDEEPADYERMVVLLETVLSKETAAKVSPEEFGQYRRTKSRANYLLGMMYLNAWGVDEDKARSMELMADASRTGDKDATMILAIAYAKGEDVEKDVDRSREFFELFDLQSVDEVNRSVENMFAGSKDAGDKTNMIEASQQFGDAISDMVSATQTEFAVDVLDEESEDYDPSFAATLLRLAADRGYEEARVRLGVLHYRGIGVERDLEAAAVHFEAGARSNWIMARYNLAAMIRSGDVKAPKGLSELELLKDAADMGLYAAEVALVESNPISPLSPEEARDMCVSAAEKKDGRALFSLAVRKSSGWLVDIEPDFSKVIALYVEASDLGFKRAQYIVGMMRMAGEGMPANPAGGFSLIRDAAYQGLPEAVFTVGRCYLGGMGVEANVYQAYDYFERAAAMGFDNAYNSLAAFHYAGILVPKNEYMAAELYLKAAGEDDMEAAQNLGNCYLQGVGVSMDIKEGLRWIAKSAELGNLRACRQLIDVYQANLLVDQDQVEVAFWEEKAAELGDMGAMKKTAFNYYLGHGHPQNKGKAIHWLDLYQSIPGIVGGGSLYYPGEYEPMAVIEKVAPEDYATLLLQADLLAEPGWSRSNRKEARKIYEKLIAKGSLAAKLRYCQMSFDDGASSRDARKASGYLKDLYDDNYSNSFDGLRSYAGKSARLLSLYYERGFGVKANASQRMSWLEKAAQLGDLDSQRQLGQLLTEDEKDSAKGIAWYLKAAEGGDRESRIAIARLYLQSSIDSVDKDSIIVWLKNLVNEGSGEARVLLRRFGVRFKEIERKPANEDTEEPEFDPWAPVGVA